MNLTSVLRGMTLCILVSFFHLTVSGQIVLDAGQAHERELAGGQAHRYALSLAAGQFVRVVAEQRGIDVGLHVRTPAGALVRRSVDINAREGQEAVAFLVEKEGVYEVEVRAQFDDLPTGRYRLVVEALRAATPADREWMRARGIIDRAEAALEEKKIASYKAAISHYEEALAILRALGDQRGEAVLIDRMGVAVYAIREVERALALMRQAVALNRQLGNRHGEAMALSRLGLVLIGKSEYREALAANETALSIMIEMGDRGYQALLRNNIGHIHDQLDDKKRALEYYGPVPALARAVGNRMGEATALNNIGAIHNFFGEMQQALDSYKQAAAIFRELRDPRGVAIALGNLCTCYERLGDAARAREFMAEAEKANLESGDGRAEALLHKCFGNLLAQAGEHQRALAAYEKSLAIHRQYGNRLAEAQALSLIGAARRELGRRAEALAAFEQALATARAIPSPALESTAMRDIGLLQARAGEPARAREWLEGALQLLRPLGDRRGEASLLFHLARVKWALGQSADARTQMEESLRLLDSLRATVVSPELRASYLGSVQDYYAFYIGMMMSLERDQPGRGFAAAAFEANERGRARSLIEMLAASRIDLRREIAPALLDEERDLRQRLNAKADRQLRALASAAGPERLDALRKEVDALTAELVDVESRIRAASPRYAALALPQPLTAAEIQRQTLDERTILLEYSLGEEQSYVWMVTREAVRGFALPKRAVIEAAARRVHQLLSRRPGIDERQDELTRALADLSEMALGPVANRLRGERLLIVVDGALQYIPFGALPLPARAAGRGAPVPLLARHEIANLPSATTLAVLKREYGARPPAPHSVAILADPVFAKSDERIAKGAAPHSPAADTLASLERAISAGDRDAAAALPRLPFTRVEAERIARIAPDALVATDFHASREAVLSADLERYRILHLATHGIINSERPELSGLVFSMVDARGEERAGVLRLFDIYNLRLPSELVVLSACRTGLGKESGGEGMIGLTRGFMHAGANRVVASLWNVNDLATAELMTRFYRGMLGPRRLSPSAALREAQLSLAKSPRWRAPYFWAPFALYGSW